MGKGPQLRDMQVWNWPFVNRLVQGIVNLKAKVRRSAGRTAYSVDKGNYPCIGCDSGLPKGRSEHNRIEDECKHFDADPSEIEEPLTCPGCTRKNADGKIRPRPRGHPDHTNDAGCRMPTTLERRFAPRTRGAGTSHPREGREAASEDPDGNATTRDLTETDVEPPTPDLSDARPRTSEHPEARGSGDPKPGSDHFDEYDLPEDTKRAPRIDSGLPRGPTVREFAPATDDSPSDWTKFSIDKSI